MPFVKGKSGNPSGCRKGSGKRQNISAAFQNFLAGKEGGKSRFELAMRRMYLEDLKTFFAYAYGKPIETQVVQNPDGSNLIPPEMIQAAAAVARLNQQKTEAEKL